MVKRRTRDDKSLLAVPLEDDVMDQIKLSKLGWRLHRGFRFPRLGFEIFMGFDHHWYFMRLPVGYPWRIM